MRAAMVLAVAATMAGCGETAQSPASPSASTPAAAATVQFATGRVFDVQTTSPAAGVLVSGSGLSAVTSDPGGNFTVGLTGASTGPVMFTFVSPNFVTRTTGIRVPGALASVSLISSTFDLAAFDQMFRGSGQAGLNRWTQAPPLVIETQTFVAADFAANSSFTTAADALTDTEYHSVLSDLQSALPQFTGSTFQNFASVTQLTATSGSQVLMLNQGAITVGHMHGLEGSTGEGNTVGFARWLIDSDGIVVGGAIMIDVDFMRSVPSVAGIVRTHELGHAFGYNHVTLEPSVMAPVVTFSITAFDIAACKLGFQRPPLNRTPDVDPANASTNALGRGAIWSPPIR